MSTFVDSFGQDKDTTDLERQVLCRELDWLLQDLRFQVNEGVLPALESCKETLSQHVEFKLPLSSSKSEALKGTVVVAGSEIVDIDIHLRLHNAKKSSFVLHSAQPLVLPQIIDASNQCQQATSLIELMLSRLKVLSDGSEISDSIWNAANSERLISEALAEVRSALITFRKPEQHFGFPQKHIAESYFDPSPPDNVAITTYIRDSNLVFEVRVLELVDDDSHTPLVRLSRKRVADPTRCFMFQGKLCQEVELVRVASQNPMLMSIISKLKAIESQMEALRSNVNTILSVVNNCN